MLAAVALPRWFLTRNLRKPTVEMERIVRAGNLLDSCTAKSDWLATVTGRVGAVVADKTLVYVKGGAAWMNTTHTLTVPAAGLGGIVGIGGAGISSSTEETAFGWVLGFGAEYAISTNWSAFIEYDYMDFPEEERCA